MPPAELGGESSGCHQKYDNACALRGLATKVGSTDRAYQSLSPPLFFPVPRKPQLISQEYHRPCQTRIQPTACQMLFTCHLIYREEGHGGGGEHRRPPGANRPCDHQLCNLGKLPNLSDLQLPLHKTEVHTTSVSGVLLK